MISIRRIIKRSAFIDDPFTAFLRFNDNALNITEPLGNLWMQFQRCFNRRLGMEFGRERDLEQNVLHNVSTKSSRGNPELITL